MEEIKLNRKDKIKILSISVLVLLFMVLGVSYAYFGWRYIGNDEASSLMLLSKELRLKYTDTQIVMGSGEFPGWSETKTLTVKNEGTGTVLYNFIWRELYNTIQKGDLVISATCSSTKGSCANLPEKEIIYAPTEVTNSYIHGPFSISAGETQTYTLTITYKETGSNQSYNNGASFRGTINIAEGAEEHPLYGVLKTLAEEGTYASTYSGLHNDSYGRTGTKDIYYIKTSTANNTTQADELINNKINVKFAGFCWQMYRTTDTGGIRLIYNGEPDSNGYCLRQDVGTDYNHKGVIASSNGAAVAMSGDYQYADSFTYNLTAGTFTLVNSSQDNYANNKSLLGKYTCKTSSSTTTCPTLYYLNTPNRATVNSPYTVTYTIGDTQHAQIGTSPFNANYRSPAYVGYKFGTAYDYVSNSAPTSGYIMGKDVYWNGSNYVLKDGNDDSQYTYKGTQNANYHYMCNNGTATCADGKVRYYYYGNYYIELLNGDTVETALTRMLEANTYDSAMKKYLENWYYNNIYGTTAEDYIEQDAVYCNDRSVKQLGGWSKTGSLTANSTAYLMFKNYDTITDFGCTNNTDKFSVSNPNAELIYPIGLADSPEMNLINNKNIRKTGQAYWTLSVYQFIDFYAYENTFDSVGSSNRNVVFVNQSIRPVITLAPGNYTVTGNGSLTNPYVVGN